MFIIDGDVILSPDIFLNWHVMLSFLDVKYVEDG